jgi:hypothetical protein
VSELQFRLTGLGDADVDEDRPRRSAGPSARLIFATTALVAVVYSGQIHKAIAVMDRTTGVSLLQAKAAVQLAQRTNAHGLFVLKEGVDKANTLKAASGTDVPAAARVTAIRFDKVGGATAAIVSPAIPGVTILYTVSGTDGYYDSQRLQTNPEGTVTFKIPPARRGVRDTISVSAVLSERTASTTFVW